MRQILLRNSGLSLQDGSSWRLVQDRKAERHSYKASGSSQSPKRKAKRDFIFLSHHPHMDFSHFEGGIGTSSAELGPWAWKLFWISPCDSYPWCQLIELLRISLFSLSTPRFWCFRYLSFLLFWPPHSNHSPDRDESVKYFRGTCVMCLLDNYWKEMFTKLVIASLFITHQNCKHLNAHPQQYGINKSWYIHTMKYDSVIKKKKETN